jgi:hypothetical protein
MNYLLLTGAIVAGTVIIAVLAGLAAWLEDRYQ